MKDLNSFWSSEIEDHIETVRKTQPLLQSAFPALIEACKTAIENGGKIMFLGNGGSAADAQHLATELTIRYKTDRAPIAAISLTTDTSALTAAGNDLGFDQVFARQVNALGQKGDVLIAISTSGKSPNIIHALEAAKEKEITTVGFTGKDGGFMPPFCDHIFIVPSETTARIQEFHILLGHLLCEALESVLGLVKEES